MLKVICICFVLFFNYVIRSEFTNEEGGEYRFLKFVWDFIARKRWSSDVKLDLKLCLLFNYFYFWSSFCVLGGCFLEL